MVVDECKDRLQEECGKGEGEWKKKAQEESSHTLVSLQVCMSGSEQRMRTVDRVCCCLVLLPCVCWCDECARACVRCVALRCVALRSFVPASMRHGMASPPHLIFPLLTSLIHFPFDYPLIQSQHSREVEGSLRERESISVLNLCLLNLHKFHPLLLLPHHLEAFFLVYQQKR